MQSLLVFWILGHILVLQVTLGSQHTAKLMRIWGRCQDIADTHPEKGSFNTSPTAAWLLNATLAHTFLEDYVSSRHPAAGEWCSVAPGRAEVKRGAYIPEGTVHIGQWLACCRERQVQAGQSVPDYALAAQRGLRQHFVVILGSVAVSSCVALSPFVATGM